MDWSFAKGPQEGEEDARFMPRRAARLRLQEVTQLRSREAREQDITVCDISTSGFMAECMRPVLIGSYVSLDLPGIGPVHAQVRWQVGGRMGGKFLDPVNIHRCDWLVARP